MGNCAYKDMQNLAFGGPVARVRVKPWNSSSELDGLWCQIW